VATLARTMGVPRATFSRRFTKLTGQPPMAYVTTWRMTVAARLLREGADSGHRKPSAAPQDGIVRPEPGPHYTNWSRPILQLV
jgi:AraC-like DNA-binding protein